MVPTPTKQPIPGAPKHNTLYTYSVPEGSYPLSCRVRGDIFISALKPPTTDSHVLTSTQAHDELKPQRRAMVPPTS